MDMDMGKPSCWDLQVTIFLLQVGQALAG
jgi:hypothetical protein